LRDVIVVTSSESVARQSAAVAMHTVAEEFIGVEESPALDKLPEVDELHEMEELLTAEEFSAVEELPMAEEAPAPEELHNAEELQESSITLDTTVPASSYNCGYTSDTSLSPSDSVRKALRESSTMISDVFSRGLDVAVAEADLAQRRVNSMVGTEMEVARLKVALWKQDATLHAEGITWSQSCKSLEEIAAAKEVRFQQMEADAVHLRALLANAEDSAEQLRVETHELRGVEVAAARHTEGMVEHLLSAVTRVESAASELHRRCTGDNGDSSEGASVAAEPHAVR